MGRPPKEQPSRHYKLTLDARGGESLEHYARQVGKAPATVAALLVRQGLERVGSGAVDQLSERDRQIAELETERDGLRRQLHEARKAVLEVEQSPRYEWPVAELLADGEWWSRWLPRLYELLGSRLPERSVGERYSRGKPQVPLARGYIDLLEFLFPTQVEDGKEVNWRSLGYAQANPVARDRWEPVIRHVAEALAAFEHSGDAAADPYTRLRLKDEIVGPWLRVLRSILDQHPPTDLQLKPLGEALSSRTQQAG